MSDNNLKRSFSGIGTGKSQIIEWNGLSNTEDKMFNDKYIAKINSNNQSLQKKITLSGREEVKLYFNDEKLAIGDFNFSIANDSAPIQHEFNLTLGKCGITSNISGKYPSPPSAIIGMAKFKVTNGIGKNAKTLYEWKDIFTELDYKDSAYYASKYWDGKLTDGSYIKPGNYNIILDNGFIKYPGSKSIVKIVKYQTGILHVLPQQKYKFSEDLESVLTAIENTVIKDEYYGKEDLNNNIRLMSKGIEANITMFDLTGLLYSKTGIKDKIKNSSYLNLALATSYSKIDLYKDYEYFDYCKNVINLAAIKYSDFRKFRLENIPQSLFRFEIDNDKGKSGELFNVITDTNENFKLLFRNALVAVSSELPVYVKYINVGGSGAEGADIKFYDSNKNLILVRELKNTKTKDGLGSILNEAIGQIKTANGNISGKGGDIFLQVNNIDDNSFNIQINKHRDNIKKCKLNEGLKIQDYKNIRISAYNQLGEKVFQKFNGNSNFELFLQDSELPNCK